MSWPSVKIGDVCSLMTGGTPKTTISEYYENGTVPWIVSGDIHKGEIFDCNKKITGLAVENSNARYLPKDSVLIALNGQGKTRGTVALLRASNATCNQSIVSINPNNQKELFSDYLFYFLKSQYRQIRNITGDKDRAGLNMPLIRSIEIPLPPIEEQKRITAILDKADATRRKRQQAIQLADDFLRSVFLYMFGDPVTNPKGYPVNKLGTNCEDLFLGLTSKVDYVDGENGYPLIRAKDINKGELSFNEVKYISETQHKKLTKNHLTRKGDLLVSKSGTLGTCAIVRTEREFSTYESIFTVRPDVTKINLHYLIHLLQNRGFKEKLIGNKVGGTVAHLNLKMFRDFEIGIPPLEIQNEFSVKIIKCEEKIEKYRQSAIEANLFFNSLSQKAFAGEL